MFDLTFFDSKLGKAALVSISAMVAMILLTSQLDMTALDTAAAVTPGAMIELA